MSASKLKVQPVALPILRLTNWLGSDLAVSRTDFCSLPGRLFRFATIATVVRIRTSIQSKKTERIETLKRMNG